MSNSKISALTSATTPLAGTETLPIVQGGVTDQVTVANLTAGRAVATAALSATGIVSTTDATDASSTTVASLKTAGGLAVVKKTYIGDNIVQGTAAKGINFTANTPAAGMTSQLLNWYEEGTWTPTFSSTGFTVGYGTRNGQYVRVGSIVTASMYVSVLSTSGTLTNALSISGLPWASNATNYGSSGVFGVDQFLIYRPSAFMDASQSKISIYRAGTVTSLTGAELAVGFYLLTISYRV